MKKDNKMLLYFNDKPPITKWILLSLQHVFAMFEATILVPILVNSTTVSNVLSIPVALVSSGIRTLIYIVCKKGKSPVYLGSSFVFIRPIIVEPMIMIIGLSLVPTAVSEIGLHEAVVPWKNVVVALVAFLTIAILAIRRKAFLK